MIMERPECRVLHVFTALGVGGAETWLMALLKYYNEVEGELPVRLRIDVCLTGGYKAAFDDEAVRLGARLFYVPYTRRNLPRFILHFRRLLRRERYHVVHDHQDYTAGLHFLFGFGLLPPTRIVHVHNPLLHIENYSKTLLRRMTVKAGKELVSAVATHVLGTSRQILTEYGFTERSSLQLSAVHCGFDVALFQGDRACLRADICREFGWGDSVKVLLFVGRLGTRQKNPEFALEVAKACIAREPKVRLLMVGGGEEERSQLNNRVKQWGLEEAIRLLGVRQDVARLMRGADLFLFPSRAEGLGMVAVEAQAAGLRVLASDAVPRECAVVPGVVRFKSLNDSAAGWAECALELMSAEPLNQVATKAAFGKSPFAIENSAKKLLELYAGKLSLTRRES